MKQALLLFFAMSFLVSCEVKIKTGEPEKQAGKFRNGIEIKENGLKVSEAYLVYDEDGSLVSNDNITDVDKKVRLVLEISGWQEENGKVLLGASEKVSTNEGDVFLNRGDLFESYTEGVSAEDAKQISLTVVISKADKIYDHFLVEFRVWDKRTNKDITGSYKLHLK
jgi:hypothetical protein